MHIWIKKDGTKPTSKGGRTTFTPHWNHAIDRNPIFISSPQQYDRELKSRGLIRSDEHPDPKPKSKPYIASKECHELARAIKQQTDSKTGEFRPGGALKEKLIQKKVIRTKKEIADMKFEQL